MIEQRDRSPYGGSNENTSISAAGNESFLSRGEDEKEEKKCESTVPAEMHLAIQISRLISI